MICPKCGHTYNNNEFRFCAECGTELKELELAPAPQIIPSYYKSYTETYNIRSGFTIAAVALSVPCCALCTAFSMVNNIPIGIVSATAVFAGLILSIVGLITISRSYVLAGAICYSLSFVFPLFGLFYMLLPIIFSWIGFANMRKTKTVYINDDSK